MIVSPVHSIYETRNTVHFARCELIEKFLIKVNRQMMNQELQTSLILGRRRREEERERGEGVLPLLVKD